MGSGELRHPAANCRHLPCRKRRSHQAPSIRINQLLLLLLLLLGG